jgi:hypothetical protein
MIDQYWRLLKSYVAYAQYCVESGLQARACKNFWTAATIAAVVIAVLLVLIIGKRIIGAQIDFYRERKRLAARDAVADEEVMRQYVPTLKDDAATQLSQAELAAKIRDAVKAGRPPTP